MKKFYQLPVQEVEASINSYSQLGLTLILYLRLTTKRMVWTDQIDVMLQTLEMSKAGAK